MTTPKTVTGTLKIATLEGVFTGAEIDLTGCDHACNSKSV